MAFHTHKHTNKNELHETIKLFATLCWCLQKWNKTHYNIKTDHTDRLPWTEFEYKCVKLEFLWWPDTTKPCPEKRHWHFWVPMSKLNIESLKVTWGQIFCLKWFLFIRSQNRINQNLHVSNNYRITYVHSRGWRHLRRDTV